MEGRSRRGFLRQLVGEVAERVIPLGEEKARDDEPEPEPELRATRGRPARARVTTDELLAMAGEAGLGGRLDAVGQLARRSVRLTLGDAQAAAHASCLGEAPARRDDPFCPAHIDLAEAAAVLGADGPFTAGTLSCLAQGNGEWRVVVDRERPSSQRWRAIDLTAELQLPRVWAAPVQALELDEAEHEAWRLLREQLAQRQGVALHDLAAELQAVHRLLGYPDEQRGDMPLRCELLARGHELGDDPPLAHAMAAEAEPHLGRWRLLLQLTIDDDLGWSWGEGRERLYLWIDERDLANGDFARICAIAQ